MSFDNAGTQLAYRLAQTLKAGSSLMGCLPSNVRLGMFSAYLMLPAWSIWEPYIEIIFNNYSFIEKRLVILYDYILYYCIYYI